LVCTDDRINVYVDFIPITSTASPDDALALAIAMYTIFELSFNKNSRTIRFLYACLHGDKRFLSNSIHSFLREKNIEINPEQNQQQSTIDMEPQSISDRETTRQSTASMEFDSNGQETAANGPSQDDFDSNSHIPIETNE
jgi:hypothetical protein